MAGRPRPKADLQQPSTPPAGALVQRVCYLKDQANQPHSTKAELGVVCRDASPAGTPISTD